jgi:hypothetical protein
LDRAASASGDELTGLDTPKFYEGWNAQRCEFASLAQDLFGNDEPSALQYVEVAEKFFRTDVFSALRGLQAAEGKASASFVAGALNMNVIDAIDLARALASRDAA